MAKTFFITGTDTDVGKTQVACALLRELAALDYKAAGYKPISAGCARTPQGLRNLDALLLQEAGNVDLPYEAINPIAYEPPIAPHIAAEECHSPISLETITSGLHRLQQSEADVVLVEGAGGWYLPLDRQHLLSDWVREQNLPVILVVGAKLGCLNHALLTFEAIRREGLPVVGWVMNRVTPEMSHYRQNLDTLRGLLPAPFLGEMPWLPEHRRHETSGLLDVSPLL
ncbi:MULTISPECIES: dethiobiotin synthase [Aeromonas]|uniref:dethiobiotin synthase n=1 Tax=Aeromonas TaxID=642 RepID=UPI0010A8BB8F|nr:dethiobiotin synthase [Aeromonas schubertii]MBZ6071121.1 dethiobiotin synthase [Aeromonas schubertii]QCG47459.1 dethiobiotin synthase [Aeromonas schubertii]